ncbi:DNA-binding response regulator [Clostridium sp. HV4-5-A1G]|uniref:DNA-binding response regulator n=1 Tax=Clostridium sp. HV4-5-A1G TaxID=2004595 RepID=UPI00123BF1F3|nr:DNA-binding response regulator [Clostridium sp. HV4-5-A1G]KAA8675497.1 hypothetical protein F3O63_04705 [Clostridium sp. HV4-5-A1G]CAB1261991.1 hypothetical protein CLOSBL3_20174 [Clostridiaceae bacterium BL-3]
MRGRLLIVEDEESIAAIVKEHLEMEGNNTVTVHVKALREKLHDSVKKPVFIQTVWGIGYRFLGEKNET